MCIIVQLLFRKNARLSSKWTCVFWSTLVRPFWLHFWQGIKTIPLTTNCLSCIIMLLACHKKSYLICDEITNFGIFTQPIPNFFSKYKTATANRGQMKRTASYLCLVSCNFTSDCRLVDYNWQCKQFTWKVKINSHINNHSQTV